MSAPQIVVAVAQNGVIGRDGDLPWRLPSDLKRFKALTLGHTLVMGRSTFHSIGRPLPGRRTIVVTRRDLCGVDTAPSVAAALAMAQGTVFAVGGTGIYREALDLADTLHITRVHACPQGDTLFPAIEGFELVRSEPGVRGPTDEHDFTFETWRRMR